MKQTPSPVKRLWELAGAHRRAYTLSIILAILGVACGMVPYFAIAYICLLYTSCRGLSEGKILLRYALPSAVVTLLPSFCQMLGLCMAGSAIVERVFSLPGLGYLIIDSVLYRDSPVIHATILFLAFSLVMFNILSDILRRILQRDASAREGARL